MLPENQFSISPFSSLRARSTQFKALQNAGECHKQCSMIQLALTTHRRNTVSEISKTPEPPYYAVIFTSHRTEGDNGYGEIAQKMVKLASQQPGFLGVESARESVGITVSYWSDIESIRLWKQNSEHVMAQKQGRKIWYREFKTRICKVESDYGFSKT
jgi:heme-degrading monooxygenase HmoA